jgi:hypothetical protein
VTVLKYKIVVIILLKLGFPKLIPLSGFTEFLLPGFEFAIPGASGCHPRRPAGPLAALLFDTAPNKKAARKGGFFVIGCDV